jgi:enoyl-CoA hydratase/carnithine racemase
MSSVLSRADAAGIATLTMERPQARNALSMELMTALIRALEAIAQDAMVKVVILRGAGPAFCAGHDLKEMRANPARAFMQQTFETCSRLMLAITRLRQPVIAEVHGIATAAGCQLVATCDLAVCAEDARFATPGVNIGLFCSTPMVALTRAVGRKAAMKMLLTGDMIDAAEAIRIGLVNTAVPSSNLHETALALAGQLAAKSGRILAIGKDAFYRQTDMTVEAAYTYAGQVMTENMMLRDAAEGIDAFLEKRKPTWCE